MDLSDAQITGRDDYIARRNAYIEQIESELAAEREKAETRKLALDAAVSSSCVLAADLAAAQATIEQMREAWSDAETKYIELLSRGDSEAAKFQAEGDMYGWNFNKGARSGAVEFHIILTKLIRAVTAPANQDALHEARALECERLAEKVEVMMKGSAYLPATGVIYAVNLEAAAHRARKEGK